MVTEMRNVGKVTSLIKDIAEGKSLLESLDGKEETLNTLNTYLKGPSSGGVSAGVTAAGAGSYGKTVNEYIQSIATNLRAGNDITLKSNELELYGGVVKGDHDVSLEAKKINVNASEDSYISNMKNIASAGNYDIFSRRGGGSINYGRGKGEGQSYNNSQIIAGNRLYSKSDELTVQGGNLRGKHTDVITKSLVLETLQDTEKNREIGVGVAFNSERQNSKNSYSGNAELLTVKRNKEWSENQSSITGTESIKVKADNGYIKGGVIANIDKNGKDGGNLSVNIKKLITEDIESKDNKLGAGVSAGVTKRAKVPATEQMVIKDANGNSIVKQNKFGMDFSGSVEGFKKEKITKATIGSGILITEEQSGPINRNINDMEQITKNVNVNKVNMNYTETKRGWGEIGAILAADAGIIGGIADSINEKWFRNQPQNMEEAWTETVYRRIRNVEDFIDKKLKNDMLPIIPTSGQYGGVLEGIQVFGIKDKFDIFDIVLKQDENGNVIITGKKLHNPSEIKSNEVFLNGMTEESEVSIRNAISQLVSINDIENKIKKGKEVSVTLVYSKTRGNITDGMESVLGKMFDGTLATFGLVTGTSRGFADVLTQLNPDRQYNITTYSQGNIVAMGGLNYLNNKGIKLNGNITFYHTGTPVAPKVFDKLSKEMNFKNGVSMINSLDPVGSEHGGFIGIKRFGLIAETKDYNGKANKTLDQLSSKIFVFGPSLMRSQAYPMLTLKQKDEYTKEEIRRLSERQILDDNFWGFVTYPHGRYFKEDREFVQRQLDYLNLVKANGGTADNKIIDNIRKERQTVTVEKFINGPIVSDEQIIDFRTNLFYDEFKENLGAHWIEKEKPLLPKLEIGASKIQSRRNSTESIDVIVERLRKQVK